MRKKEFVGYTVLIGCGWSAYFIFIGLSSFYFQTLANYTAKEYSYIILVVTFGYLIGTNLTRYFNYKNTVLFTHGDVNPLKHIEKLNEFILNSPSKTDYKISD